MQNTMNLLATALKVEPIPAWTKKLGLSAQALYNARDRGHLSPAIAGALAEELGQDPKEWIVVAALESERDSACKTRMVKRMGKVLML
ncbi:hypothetical protein SAMN05216567_116142 [Variovorax sp. OK605]|jgi:hypothetical protein|uniref:hypothetical protein n=1 Tax=Variovorax sp. OK605 TaxID=1855317 RepID=UPI0008E46DD4|nr:hypothetical protein [Variovorax sp. OK605]SFQ45657.1 hypothetical protein SAMN05216567_116142 [Variovorax sp. OK605]